MPLTREDTLCGDKRWLWVSWSHALTPWDDNRAALSPPPILQGLHTLSGRDQ